MRNKTFCIDDLMLSFPTEDSPSLSSVKSTMTRLIHSRKIARVSRGVYTLIPQNKNELSIILSEQEKKIAILLKERFPLATFCIYNGSTLSTLQHHLSLNNATYVETEREVVEAAFNLLRDNGYNAFANPNADIMYNYVDLKSQPVIVKPLITESPTQNQDGITVPTLEKLLIDIQKDSDFNYLQGAETDYMMSNAESLYLINQSRLKRYARRRNVKL